MRKIDNRKIEKIICDGREYKGKKLYLLYPWSNDESHPLYQYGYTFIGMTDGWIIFDQEKYNEAMKILEEYGWIKWI